MSKKDDAATGKKKPTPRPWGQVEQLKSGKWRVRYTVKGKRYVSYQTFPDERTANRWRARKYAEVIEGRFRDPKKVAAEEAEAEKQERRDKYTLGEFWPVFIKEAHWAPSHLFAEERRYHARLEERWADVPLKEITHQDIAEWLDELKTMPRKKKGHRRPRPQPATAATKQKCLELLRRILSEAADRDLIDYNPVLGRKYLGRKARAGKKPDENRAIARDIEHVRTLLDNVPEYARPVWWMMAFCGLRSEEAKPLRLKDFDFDNNLVKITHTVTGSGKNVTHRATTKTAAGRRVIPLDPRVSLMLQNHCKQFKITRPNQYLVEARTQPGACIGSQVLREQSERICKRHKIEPYITLHQLRHTGITTARRLGTVNSIDVKEWAGHAHNDDITDHYTHSDLDRARQIAVHVADAILGTPRPDNVVQLPARAAVNS